PRSDCPLCRICWNERQRDAVHAVAQAGGGRTVGEDVAKMAAAAAAMHLGARIAELVVGGLAHRVVERLPEAGPAGAAVVLGGGVEEWQVAALAGEDAGAVLVEQRRGPGALGRLLAEHGVFELIELGAPLGFGLLDLERALSGPAFGGLTHQHAGGAERDDGGRGQEKRAASEHRSSSGLAPRRADRRGAWCRLASGAGSL